jgi:hypothetical protein
MCDRARGFTRGVVVLAVLAVVTLMAASAAAQSTTGTILGKVTDSGGLVLPGATVTVKNTETGLTRTVVTDGEGSYIVSGLPPGLHQLEVALSGFRPFRQDAFRLATAQNARVDAQLSIGGLTEQVEVVANAVRVDTTSSSVSTNIDPQRVSELPMVNRSLLSMVQLAPGITEVTVPEAIVNNDNSGSVVSGATGGRTNQNDIQLDGAAMTTSLYNRPSNLPSPDAIQEFQVLTNAYSAEFGRGGGTTMIAITKSGTNTFRGAAWEYHRNDALNGKNYFATSKPYMNRNQYGANLGGPLIKDRTFFFFNWEGLRLDQETLLRFNPPSAAHRAGDLSLNAAGAAQRTIFYDPLTQQPFPGNRIPADRIHPIARRILSYVPEPNLTGGVYQTNIKRDTRGDQFSVKFDHKLTEANSLNVRYHHDYPTAPDDSSDIEQFHTRIGNETHAWSAADTHLFGNGMVGEGRGSWSDIATTAELNPTAAIHPRELGFTNVDVTEPWYPIRVPVIQVAGNAGAFNFNPTQSPRVRASKVGSANYKLSWVAGRHNVKLGGEFVYKWQQTFRHHNSSSGQFVFNGEGTRRLSDGSGGLGMADFLLGSPASYSQATLFDKTDWTWSSHYFVQDDVRINRMTLNLGLRVDHQTPWIETGDRIGNYVPGQQSTRYPQAPRGLVYPGDEGVRQGIIRSSIKLNPRVGFAYDVRGDGRTAIRAGYGKFATVIEAILVSNMNEVPPFHPNVVLQDPSSFADPWGPGRTPIFPYVRNDQGEGPFPTQGFTLESTDPDWKPGDLHQFNVTFQQQLGDQIVVSAGYVGSRGRNLSAERILNRAIFIPGQSTPQNVEARRPDQNLGGIAQLYPGSWSDYDSLQVTAAKQYSDNYTVQLTYTLGRTYDDGNVGEHTTQTMNPDNPRLDHALSSNDRTHVLRINGMYELPRLQDRPAAMRLIVGGWRLAGIMSYLSGNMVNVTSGVDRALQGCFRCGPQRPNLNGDPTLPGDRSLEEKTAQWFNTDTTTLWTLPPLGQFGNTPRNAIRGPGRFGTDLSLTKILRLSSVNSRRIEIRIEAFNVFDNVQLNNPNGDRNNANFGRITSALDPRIVQLALRFEF